MSLFAGHGQKSQHVTGGQAGNIGLLRIESGAIAHVSGGSRCGNCRRLKAPDMIPTVISVFKRVSFTTPCNGRFVYRHAYPPAFSATFFNISPVVSIIAVYSLQKLKNFGFILSGSTPTIDDMNTAVENNVAAKRHFSGLQVLGIIAVVMLVTVLITAFVVKRYLWPSDFRPVELNKKEELVLDAKLQRLQGLDGTVVSDNTLVAQAYTEENSRREIFFDERELNALIAKNTNLANRLAIDLSSNLASANLLVPMAEDFPVVGGKTLRVTAGVEMSFTNNRPVIILKGVSMMGVPIPNAWLGNLKNVDLVSEFGGDAGFWKTFSDGVELIQVTDGKLQIKLKE